MTRTRLLLGTALAALALAAPAAAQFPDITDVQVTAGGGAPVITDVGTLRLVTLNAPRTYLDHGQGFVLSSGDTVRFNFANPGRDGVALLRSDAGFFIEGTVEGRLGPSATDPLGGNLWFFTRSGIILGTGGRVAAGGILLSNAMPDLLLTPAGREELLAPDRLTIEANLGPLLTTGVLLSSGASVEASDGFLAIVAQNVRQEAGSDIRAERGTALVGAANSYTIRLARNATNDFDLVEFEVPAGEGTRDGGAPIDLAGTVRGANVWLSLVGSTDLVSAIIRATGTVVATAATVDQGQIVLSAGSGIAGNAPGPPNDTAPTRIRAELADLAADGDIRIRQDEGELLTAFAGGDIRIETREAVPPGLTALGALEAGGSIRVEVGGDVTGLAPLTAGGDILVRSAGAVTLGSLSAGDDIVAVADGPLVAGGPGTTIESRNAGPDVTRDSDQTDPSGGPSPIRSLHLESDKDRVQLAGLVTGFTQGSVLSAFAVDIDIDTGTAGLFLDGGLAVRTQDLLSTSRIALADSFTGAGPSIRFAEIVSGPLRLAALGNVQLDDLSAEGFAGIDAAGGVTVGNARVAAGRGNPGSLALTSDAGPVTLGGADVDGDLILIARQANVNTLLGASLRFGDDLYVISGRESLGRGILFNPGTTLESKPGFDDVAGNEILDNGDPALLVPDFDRDFAGNGRVAELLALAQFGNFPAGISGDVRFEGGIQNIDLLELRSDSASIRFLSPESRLAELVANAEVDVALTVEAAAAPSFFAGRDATLVVTGTDPVTLIESGGGRDLSITAGGALSLVSALAGRDARLTAASLDAAGLAGPIRNARFTTTAADLAVDALSVSGSIALTSAAGLAAGTLAAGDDILLAAAGAATVDLATITPGTDQDGDGFNIVASAASLVAGGLDGADDIRVTTTGATTLPRVTRARRDILVDAGTLSAASLEAGRDIAVEVRSGPLLLDDARAGDDVRIAAAGDVFVLEAAALGNGPDDEGDGARLLLSGASVDAQTLAATGDIGVLARSGAARLGVNPGASVTAGGSLEVTGTQVTIAADTDIGLDIRLTATAGDIGGGTLAAVRDLALAATGDIALASATAGRDLGLDAGEGVNVGTATAGRDLAARGAALALGALAAGRDIDLETTRDDLALSGGLAAAGNLRLVSAAALSAAGPLSAGGEVTLRARDDAPAGVMALATVTAGGDLDARAWTVRATRLAAGGSARVTGTGPGSIEADEIVADDDVDLESPSIRVGLVRSTGLGPDTDGDGFNVRLAGGLGDFGAIEAPTDIRARMTGALAIADATAGRDADLEAASLRILTRATGLVAGRDARLVAAGALEAGRVSAGDDVTMEAGGAAALGSVEARGDGADAEGDGANIRLVAAGADALALSAPGDIAVDATTGPATLGRDGGVTAGRDLAVTGTTLDLTGASAGRDLSLAATAGDIVGPAFAAVRDLALAASGRIEASTVTAGRDLDLAAGGSLEILDTAAAGRDARLAGASVLGPLGFPFSIAAGRDIRIESTAGDVSVRATAGDDVSVRAAGTLVLAATATGEGEDAEGDGSRILAEAAGAAFLEASSAAGDFDLAALGSVQALAAPTAGGSLRITGAEVQLPLGATAGTDAEIRATGGLLFTSGLVRAGRDIALAGADGDRVNVGGTGLLAGRDIAVSGDEIALNSGVLLAAGRDARLLATGFIGTRGASVEAGRDVELATDRGINFGRLAAGDDIRVASSANLVLGEEVLTTGLGPDTEGDGSTVGVSGTFVEIARGASAGDMRLEGRDAVFAGFRDGSPVAPGLTAGRDLVVRSDSVRLNLAGIGRNLDAEARTGGIEVAGSIAAPGSVRLQALLFVDVAGGISAGADVDVRSRESLVRVDGPVTAGDDLRLAAGAPGVQAGALTTTGLGPDGEGDGPVMEVRGGTITLGPVTAARDFLAESPGAVAIEQLATVRDARVTAASLALGATGGIGRDLLVTATGAGFTAPGPLAAGRDIRVEGAGDVRLSALEAGRDVAFEAGESLETGAIAAPGSLAARAARMTLAGATVGGAATLETTAGELALPGTVSTGGTLRLRAPEAAGGILRLGRVTAGGAVDARAFSILSAPGGGVVTSRGSIRMVGTGSATIDLEEVVADDDVDLASPVIRVGRVLATGLGPDGAGDGFNIRLDGGTGTFGTLAAPTDILARFTAGLSLGEATAGRDMLLSAGSGLLAIGQATAAGVASLVGGSFALRDRLAGREVRFVATGPLRFGGAPGGPGFVVSAADIARIDAPAGISASTGAVPRATTPQGPASAAFEAGFGVGGTADLVVDRFGFDPAKQPVFGFYAGAAARIRVVGDVTPTEAGGRLILGANPIEGLTPGAVLVAASLGAGELFLQDCYAALVPLANISITALSNVIFGLADFQVAVAAADPAAIDVQAGAPGLPPSPADDRLWVVAETMTITAPGRIVAQNTSSVPGSFAGLVLANRQAGPLVPTVLTVNGGSVVDLSGVIVNGEGRAFFGPQAARSGAILAGNPAARFNGCSIGGTESCLPPLADPALGFRLEQFAPLDPFAGEPGALRGTILLELADRGTFQVGVEDGAILIRRDEEEDRPDRRAPGR